MNVNELLCCHYWGLGEEISLSLCVSYFYNSGDTLDVICISHEEIEFLDKQTCFSPSNTFFKLKLLHSNY